MLSETVFLGDTAISLQTPAPTLVMGGGFSGPTQIQSPSTWSSFHFRGRRDAGILDQPKSFFITDSLSHTTCVESNNKC